MISSSALRRTTPPSRRLQTGRGRLPEGRPEGGSDGASAHAGGTIEGGWAERERGEAESLDVVVERDLDQVALREVLMGRSMA